GPRGRGAVTPCPRGPLFARPDRSVRSDLEHGLGRHFALVLAGDGEVLARLLVVGGPEVAAVAVVLHAAALAPLEHPVRAAAPGTALVPFDVTAGGLREPLARRALGTDHA